MEDEVRKTVKFQTLLSNDSGDSMLSDESCIYYQTEIFNQLPSYQACRPHARQGERVGNVAQDAEPKPGENRRHVPLAGENRDKASSEPLRSLAECMQAKREARDRRRQQMRSIGCWESWRRSQSIARKRLRQQVGGAIPRLLPWRQTLHTIEGRFGVGVKSYFVFLRYLIFCSLLHCAIISGFILEPSRRYGRGNTSEPLLFRWNDSFTDLFLVSGFLERSPLFYGFYTRGSLDQPCLNTPLLFLIGILSLLFLSLVMVVRRTVVGYKHTWLLGNRYNFHVSYKIFCGWDYNIQDPPRAALEHSFILNDLKVYLEEQSFHEREAQRTCPQWARLYFLRVFINFLVVSMLVGAFVLIYYATEISQRQEGKHGNWLVSIMLQYLPPFTISLVNLLFPHVFRIFSSFEDYSLSTQVNATLLRSIFLKLACLGIFLFFLFGKKTQECWENQFGKEMYKLCLFDFLAAFCNTFFFMYPLRLLGDRWPSSWLARLSRKQSFQIPLNVLDLVYTQTVSWVGVFHCPLLPLLGTAKLVALLYIKKFMVIRCCVPEQRMFRASSSTVLFHLMLLLGLIMAIATLGFNFLRFQPSPGCGPFAGTASVFNVTGVCVASLPGPAQTALRYLSSEAFILPLILAEIVVLTSLISRGRRNRKTIDRLKEMLVMSSSDKQFLVKQHATLLRRHRRDNSTPAQRQHSPLPCSTALYPDHSQHSPLP